jgi:DNA polymerase I
MPSLRLFVDMEPRGVHINWNHLIEQKKEIDRLLRIEEKRIYKLAGRRFGLTTDEKSRVLEEMGLPNHGLQEAKPIYAVNDETLGKWEAEGFEIAKHIRRWTSLHTILSLYVGDPGNESHDAPDEFDSTNPTTGVSWRTNDKTNAYWTYRSRKTNDTRLFPSYSVMLARSHRNRMGSPNFQQVPHHSAEDWRVRGCFMPPSPDYVISEFDYSALQLRIAAIIAPDQTMLDAFRKGMDLHSVTAHSIFTPEISIDDFLEHRKEDPYKGYRYIGKQLNFTLLFGGGAATFADRSVRPAWSIEDCMAYIEKNSLSVIDNYKTQQPDPWLTVADNLRGRFFETYRGLSCWHKKSEALAKRDGYIESPHGARRMLPQIRHIGPKERLLESKLKNISLNSPVQNFEIVIVHRAMRNLVDFFREGGYKSRLWGTVHDSLAFYLHRDEVEIMWKAIPTLMSRDHPEYNGVKFEVEGDISDYYHDPPRYWGYGVSLEEYLNECK